MRQPGSSRRKRKHPPLPGSSISIALLSLDITLIASVFASAQLEESHLLGQPGTLALEVGDLLQSGKLPDKALFFLAARSSSRSICRSMSFIKRPMDSASQPGSRFRIERSLDEILEISGFLLKNFATSSDFAESFRSLVSSICRTPSLLVVMPSTAS